MILADFILHSRVNAVWQFSGIDSIELCLDKKHFKNYPHRVEYVYNSRGFRDQEWPESVEELKNAIWCIGDSFTAGIGAPLEHTWPYLLQQQTGRRCINISMDGASNEWIARKGISLLNAISPDIIIAHWSYTSRRESPGAQLSANWTDFYNNIKGPEWPVCESFDDLSKLPNSIQLEIKQHDTEGLTFNGDEQKRMYVSNATVKDDNINTLSSIAALAGACTSTKLVHSFIPNFCTAGSVKEFFTEFNNIADYVKYSKIDTSRDGQHYDILTARSFVDKLVEQIC
jgi:hypothetical protein